MEKLFGSKKLNKNIRNEIFSKVLLVVDRKRFFVLKGQMKKALKWAKAHLNETELVPDLVPTGKKKTVHSRWDGHYKKMWRADMEWVESGEGTSEMEVYARRMVSRPSLAADMAKTFLTHLERGYVEEV